MERLLRWVKCAVFALLALGLTANSSLALESKDYAIEAAAAVTTSPPAIRLYWPSVSHGIRYHVRRKAIHQEAWTHLATLPGTATQYVDSQVAVGSAFEYEIELETNLGQFGVKAHTYLYAGIDHPMVDQKGKVLLVVDASLASGISAELDQFSTDLILSGWRVSKRLVNRWDSVPSVKNAIKSEYNADPTLRSVVLIGHVPVPYSGLIAPDFHEQHRGAWPADGYYAELDGTWTDSSVNKTNSEMPINNNVPGDGKFDQSNFPSPVDLEIGRIDFYDLPAFSPRTEIELLRTYFRKNHQFRHRQFTLKPQGLVRDNFGDLDGDAPAVDAWRHYTGWFGPGTTREIPAESFFSALASDSYLWAYGCGGGGYRKADGVGSTGDFALNNPQAAFLMLHGSYFGDWNSTDNFLRGAIATPGYTLASVWTGLPHWYMHHLALGQTLGFATRIAQNNVSTYKSHLNFFPNQVHVSLIGDPTLELFPVLAPSNLRANVATGVSLSWDTSPEADAGYHVYKASAIEGPYTRLSAASPTASASFFERSVPNGTYYYMVRAIKRQVTGSGTFLNASPGIILKVEKNAPVLPVVSVAVVDAEASELNRNPGSFRVSRNENPASALTVNFDLAGSATAGVDYDHPGFSVTIPANSASATVEVKPVTDDLKEGLEQVTLSIKTGTGYAIGGASAATLNLADHFVNEPPTLSTIPDVRVNQNSTSAEISFQISDKHTPAEQLTVQAVSSVASIIPQSGIVFGGAGTNRTIRFTPAANAYGTSTVTITISDGQLNTTKSFKLLVNAVPSATPKTAQTLEDRSVAITLSGQDVDSSSLTFVILTPPANGTISGLVPSISYQPAANFFGDDSFSYAASDGQATSAPVAVRITVSPVGDPPTLGPLTNLTFAKNTVIPAIAIPCADPDTALATLALTASSDNAALIPTNGFAFSFVEGSHRLRISAAPKVAGTARITISAKDNTNSVSETFTVTLTNSPPAAAADAFNAVQNQTFHLAISELLQNDVDPDRDLLAVTSVESRTTGGRTVALGQGEVIITGSGPLGTDSFHYTIRDESGAAAAARVTLIFHPPARISSMIRARDATVFLHLEAWPNATFEVSGSSNTLEWSSLGQGQADTSGKAVFRDTSAALVPARVYRVKWF